MKRTYTFVAAFLLLTANLFGGAPAFAHDEVVSVSPEVGSSVEAGVIDLNITFNEDVLTTDGSTGFDVAVTNAKEVSQQVGCISPMGSSLSARVAIGEPGEYTVSWHSVSNDGHPSEGTYKFTVTGTAEIAADEINNCPRLLIAPAPSEMDPSAIAYSTADDVNANDNTPLELGLLIFVLLVILGSAIWVTKKSKRAKD